MSNATPFQALRRRHLTARQVAVRAEIILAAAEGQSNAQIARSSRVTRDSVRLWRSRWIATQPIPLTELGLEERLTDAPRAGRTPRIAAEQICRIVALACQAPESSGRPITHWSGREIADEITRRGIVDRISPRHAARLLKDRDLRPHLVRSWLTPVHQPGFEDRLADINRLYAKAAGLAARRERVVSTDEMTGVQALERIQPSLPMTPGQPERREYEYTRRGTLSFIVSRDVATGQVIAPGRPNAHRGGFPGPREGGGGDRSRGGEVARRGGQPQHPLLGVAGPVCGRGLGDRGGPGEEGPAWNPEESEDPVGVPR